MKRLALLLDRTLVVLATILLMVLLGSVVIGVASRQAGMPTSWSEELAQYVLVWTGFVGLMIAARRRNHIRIDMFLNALPARGRRAGEITIQLSIIAFAVAMLHFGTPLIARNWDIDWVSLPLPSGLLYLPIPFAAALIAGQAVVEIADVLKGRSDDQAPKEALKL
jgi:TRAP-type C4-dicarboxylate transport system permease small subunit